jgi:hypothetical protein
VNAKPSCPELEEEAKLDDKGEDAASQKHDLKSRQDLVC